MFQDGKYHKKYLFSVDEKQKRIQPVSETTFLVGSLGIFSVGVLMGVLMIMRREKYKLAPKDRTAAIGMASKALGLGTLLCVGSFAGIGGLFIGATGISTVQEFGVFAKKIVQSTGLPSTPENETIDRDLETKEFEEEFEKVFHNLSSTPKEGLKNDEVKSPPTEKGSLIQTIRSALRSKFSSKDKSPRDCDR